jgi:hypothetical protein
MNEQYADLMARADCYRMTAEMFQSVARKIEEGADPKELAACLNCMSKKMLCWSSKMAADAISLKLSQAS